MLLLFLRSGSTWSEAAAHVLTCSMPAGLGRPAAGQACPTSKGGFEELLLTQTATPRYGSQP